MNVIFRAWGFERPTNGNRGTNARPRALSLPHRLHSSAAANAASRIGHAAELQRAAGHAEKTQSLGSDVDRPVFGQR
jgi:hypothetical protein